MRRALFATAATVVGLVALLDYKSSFGGSARRLSIGTGTQNTGASTTTPSSSSPTTGSGSTATTAPPTTSSGGKSGTFTSQALQYQYGDLQVQITVRNGKITDITFPTDDATDPRSESINSQALPILVQEALQAQSLNIDIVSGATYTSNAFGQDLQAVMQSAGLS